MLRILFKALNVKPGEEARVLLLLGNGFFMGIFLATYQITAESLFESLKEFIAQGILVSGILGVITTALFTYVQNKIKFSHLAIFNVVVVLIISVALYLFYAVYPVIQKQYIVFAMFALIGPVMAVLLLGFWGVFGRLFDLRQSKRIIGGIDTGQLSAAILTFFAISIFEEVIPNFNTFPTENFLIIGSISLLFSITFLVRLVNKFDLDVVRGQFESGSLRTPLRAFLANNYILLLATFMILSTAIYWFVENAYLNVLYDQYESENQLRAFLGWFNGSILILSFLLQTFFNDRIIANYGLKISLWILPVVALIFTVLSIVSGQLFGYTIASDNFFFFFLFVALNKLFISFLREALENPTFKLYFMPLDIRIRFDIQAKVEGVISQIAKAGTGGIILALGILISVNLISYSYILLGLIAIMFFIVSKLYIEYKNKVREKLESQQASSNTFEPERVVLIRRLQHDLPQKKAESAVFSFKLLEKLNPALISKSINFLIEHGSESVQNFAINRMNELKGLSVSDYYVIGHKPEFSGNGKKVVSGPDLEILLKTGEVDKRRISKLSRSENASDRQYAAELIGNSTDHDNISYLIDLLHDSDYNTRMAAMLASQKRYNKEVTKALIENLKYPSYSNTAQNSLVMIGIDALPVLDSAFYRTAQDPHTLLKIVQIIGLIGGNTARKLLWNKIDFPDKVLVSQILKSLGESGFKANLQQITRIKYALESDVEDISWNFAAMNELPRNEFTDELKDAIKEENEHDIEHIYMLLGMLYDPRSIQLVKENIESGTSEGITYAIELLDVFLSEDLKQKIIPILDDISVHEKAKKMEIFFPRERLESEEVLKHLINRDYNQTNRWTKAITIYQIGHLKIKKFTFDLIANLFNPDWLVKEVAAWSLYQIDKNEYEVNTKRLGVSEKKSLDHIVKYDKTGQLLRYQKVKFLRGLQIFQKIPGLTLANIVDEMTHKSIAQGESCPLNAEGPEYFYLIYKGKADLYSNGQKVSNLQTGYFLTEMMDSSELLINKYLISEENTILLEINKDKFYELLSDDIPFARRITQYMETI